MPARNHGNNDEEEMESRFAHLLVPIRDLNKNWEIDLASQLEDYLTEIDKISISFDGGKTSMDFIEAAMMIQGSATVYAKKVEHLHQLVYQALDIMSAKRGGDDGSRQGGPLAGGRRRTPAAAKEYITDFSELSEELPPEKLDCKLQPTSAQDKNIIVKSQAVDLALLQAKESDKTGHMLYGVNNEEIGRSTDFQIVALSSIDPKGMITMALEAQDHQYQDYSSAKMADSQTATLPHPEGVADGEVPAPPPTEELDNVSFDDDDGGKADAFEEPENFDAIPPQNMGDQDGGEATGQKEGYALRERAQPAPKPPVEPEDPWKVLDCHIPGKLPARPFKNGKVCIIPASLQKLKGGKKRKLNKEIDKPLPSITEFISKAFFSYSSKYPKSKAKTPTFVEFDTLYYNEYQRRQPILKQRKKELAAFLAQQGHRAEEDGSDWLDPNQPMDAVDGMELVAGDSDSEVDDCEAPDLPGSPPPTPQLVWGIQSQALEIPLEEAVEFGYEDLVKQHVNMCLVSAQKHVKESEITRRVREWEDKIAPILLREETHGPFDIHLYGTQILDTFKHQDNTPFSLPFSDVVYNKPSYEICRLFLSTLQLANNYNIEVGVGIANDVIDSMTIRLMSTKRHHEQLENYQVPSLKTSHKKNKVKK